MDCLFTYLPVTESGQEDMEKMKVENMIHQFDPSKGIMDFVPANSFNITENVNRISDAMKLSTGHIEDIEESDHKEKYYKFSEVRDDYVNYQAQAASEFLFIKTGTADAGGIGNAVMQIMYHHYKVQGIALGGIIRQQLTQATLDMKSSAHDKETLIRTFAMIRSRRDPKRKELAGHLMLYVKNDIAVNKLLDVLYNGSRWRGGISRVAAEDVPFSKILYRGDLTFLYRSATNHKEESIATFLAQH
jgi:hypothetical protein